MLSQCPDTSTFAPLSAKAVIGRTVEMVKGKTMISHLYETKNICGLRLRRIKQCCTLRVCEIADKVKTFDGKINFNDHLSMSL